MKKNSKKQEAPTDITTILKEIRHYLPSQGPIKDFIHHNTLHAFQEHNLSFDESIRQASRLYGAREYLPVSEFRALFKSGKISDEALNLVLASEGGDTAEVRHRMLYRELADVQHRPGFRRHGYMFSIKQQCGIVLEEQIHPHVFRLVASYLDQGMAAISLGEGQLDFWSALRQQLRTGKIHALSAHLTDQIRKKSPEDIVADCLEKLLPEKADRRTFLLEVLMAARGWSGLIAQVEDRPESLSYPRLIKLVQYVALYLAIFTERATAGGWEKSKLDLVNTNTAFFAEHAPVENEGEKICRLWLEAMELSFYLDTLRAIRVNAGQKRGRFSKEGKTKFQALFCIDDRESSFRRYLEELTDGVETFATPGFFAIDAVYQGPYDAISIKQCPVPVTPRHRIRGIAKHKRKLPASRIEMNFWHRYANNLVLGWLISLVFGLFSLVRLGISIAKPSRTFATASSFAAHDDETDLHYERPDGEAPQDGYFEGYTVSEMAERVARVLRQIGLTHNFAALVAVVGHGSSSTNNPYFAAYDCGACSGRPGFVNARTYATMANRDDVRRLLKAEGIDIPLSTRFIGAIHDTARDEIIFMDEDDVMAHHSDQLKELNAIFNSALEHNAHERTRRFAILNFPYGFKKAMKEVRLRTEMLFEPRPEYNHATNALAIVARRSLSENLFLDRRAFFNSYDPRTDKDGKILNGILTPLVPVCAGINLEYLFSRMDNSVFGAGSKLPHNVFSLLGVGNGAEGDLRTGLPEQMIEIHDPLRLFILVEQRKDIVLKVLEGNPAVMQWIEKEWVKFCIYDYVKDVYYWYRRGAFEKLSIGGKGPQVFPDSISAYRRMRDNIAPGYIQKAKVQNG